MNPSDTSTREFVASFTKTCSERGIIDPNHVAELLKIAVTQETEEQDALDLLCGVTKQCEASGVNNPEHIAGLFKMAIAEVMKQKPYSGSHEYGKGGAKSIFNKYENAARMYKPGDDKKKAKMS